jgi:hypothetical protein
VLERLEVIVVGYAREAHDGDLELPFAGARATSTVVECQRVFVGDAELGDVGQDAEHRHACPLLEEAEARVEQANVAAEFVDDESGDARTLVRLEELHRPNERREDAASIDVSHEEHGRIGNLRDEHVHEVAILEIDLRRAARPLDDDQVVARTEPRERATDHVAQLRLAGVVFDRAEAPDRLAENDDLRSGVALGLQQDRVHVDRGDDPGGLGLDGLRAPDLAPVRGNERVQCHVLRLERRHVQARLPEVPAERRRDDALADRRGRTLDHDRARRHASTCASADTSRSRSPSGRDAMRT